MSLPQIAKKVKMDVINFSWEYDRICKRKEEKKN